MTFDLTSTTFTGFGFSASADTPPTSAATNSATSSPDSTPRSKYKASIRSEDDQAGSVSERMLAKLGPKTDGELADWAPTVADGYFSASKIVRKAPPPARSGRLKHRNPVQDMKPGDALECPAENAGISYEAAKRRVSSSLKAARKRGWEMVTRREGGSLWVYRIA